MGSLPLFDATGVEPTPNPLFNITPQTAPLPDWFLQGFAPEDTVITLVQSARTTAPRRPRQLLSKQPPSKTLS
jgi:hypothetical protein